MAKNNSVIVFYMNRYKSVHGDYFVRPTIKGSKVKKGQNLKLLQITKIKVKRY